MAQPRSPQEVFLALVNAVADGRWEELPDFYAEQADVVHPFDPLRGPALRSREAIRQYSSRAGAGPRQRRRVANVTIHETTDPEVIVAEFEYQGTDDKGEQVALPAIFVLRVRDGEIVSSRDYHDHLASARARGQLDQLVAAINEQTAAAGTDAETR
jgi:ketosteroid isomerase-like protein